MTATDIHTLAVDPRAQEVLTRMQDQCAVVNQFWGRVKPDEVAKMSLSLTSVLSNLLGRSMGSPTTVHRDGDLSLYVSTPAFVYGVIFFRAGRPDVPVEGDAPMTRQAPLMGRYCLAYVENGRCGEPVRNGKPTCEGHEPLIVAAPVLGDWSTHS